MSGEYSSKSSLSRRPIAQFGRRTVSDVSGSGGTATASMTSGDPRKKKAVNGLSTERKVMQSNGRSIRQSMDKKIREKFERLLKGQDEKGRITLFRQPIRCLYYAVMECLCLTKEYGMK